MSGVAATDPVAVERRGDVTLLRLRAGENRFNPGTLTAIEDALDDVERAEGPGALVITGEGKFFSNGLDLDWMATAPPGGADDVLARVHALLGRLLAFPTATVAAVNGHAFAAGAMLALACDLRVMREDRGFLCLPEVDLGLPFTPEMGALLGAKLTPQAATRTMVLGERLGGPAAAALGLVDVLAPEDRVVEEAVARAAAAAGRQRHVVQAIKRGLHAEALAVIAPAVAEA